MKEILSGNEAIARGAYEAGVRLACAYPGTPSTEILESVAGYPEIYSEWNPNEKVAMEVGLGSSLAGARTLVCMKHVGVNVAADPLFTASYTGVEGGLVLVTADDPDLHSSQNEQDNRNYARFAKIPLIEPADSQEAKDLLKLAFEISERFDTPVLFRSTTRISHSKGLVELNERPEVEALKKPEKKVSKYTMLPAFARRKHPQVEDRIRELREYGSSLEVNRIEQGDPQVGIVSSGISYQYAREAFPEASFLKLTLSYPLPEELVRRFRSQVDKLYVVEELDPILEEELTWMGVEVDGGKDLLSLCGELDPGTIARALTEAGVPDADPTFLESAVAGGADDLPMRPPTLCPGCSHRGIFTTLRRLGVYVCGDIGCYTLGALPPLEAMHSCVCMGAGVGMAHGMSKVTDDTGRVRDKAVSVIGDSTFFHSGVTGLMNIVWNKGTAVTIILDNRTTAMTGGQHNPGTGHTLDEQEAPAVDIPALAKALGIKRVRELDPYDLAAVETVMKEELAHPDPSVVIATGPCVLEYKIEDEPYEVDLSICDGCGRCLRVGCVALSAREEGDKKWVEIDESLCTGCSVCAQMCRPEAIKAPRLKEEVKS